MPGVRRWTGSAADAVRISGKWGAAPVPGSTSGICAFQADAMLLASPPAAATTAWQTATVAIGGREGASSRASNTSCGLSVIPFLSKDWS